MKKTYIVLLLAVTIFQSCNYLDTEPLGSISSEYVFTSPELARANLLTVYNYTPTVFYSAGGAQLEINTLHASHSFPWGFINSMKNNDYDAVNSGFPFWNNFYSYIGTTNTFIQGVQKADFDANTKNTMLAEARFLRAYFYFNLYCLYGGVPLITVPQSLDDPETVRVKRNSADETIDFVIEEFSESAPDLPVEWKERDRGRIEKGAALGMKAKALLYKASQKNDVNLFRDAAKAAKDVIELNRYALYKDYRKIFSEKSSVNKELIFYYNREPNKNSTNFGWTLLNAPMSSGAWGGTMPSQNLVDKFFMTDGKLPSESPLYDPQDPYKNRDPRFSMTIYHQGSTFKGVPLDFSVGGKDYIVNGYVTTGYYVAKAIDESIEDLYEFAFESQSYVDPILRYADVLLMYAEAQNEVAGPDDSVYDAVWQVRNRDGVKMPALPAGLDKDQMRKSILHERIVELSFEESYFYDIRRRNIAKEASSGALYGAKITKSSDGSLIYDKQIIETRQLNDKNILFPIPNDERVKNTNLTQNEGY